MNSKFHKIDQFYWFAQSQTKLTWKWFSPFVKAGQTHFYQKRKNDAVKSNFGTNYRTIRVRDCIFTFLRSPRIDSAILCSMAGRYDNPNPIRFLAPIDCYKILALRFGFIYLPLQYFHQTRTFSTHSCVDRWYHRVDRVLGFLSMQSSQFERGDRHYGCWAGGGS